MMFPLPEREDERLTLLRGLNILDSEPAPEFDSIVALARDLFGAPIVLISLLDAERTWFKAKCGIGASQAARDLAFCNYAVLSDAVFVVEDAAADPRFASNDLVLGPPHIRFYAGAPLIAAPGLALGSLCIIGPKPSRLSDSESRCLQRLALVVVGLIKGHSKAREAVALVNQAASLIEQTQAQAKILQQQSRTLELNARRFKQTETMAGVGGWELDLSSDRVTWSDQVYRIYDMPLATPIDRSSVSLAFRREDRLRLEALTERCLTEGLGYDEEFEVSTRPGIRKWVRIVCDAEYRDGKPSRLFGILQDISERRRSEERLWQAANTDALTGLANRHNFARLLKEAFNPASAGCGLLMIDADGLKQINDTLGHAAGDALIITIAKRILGEVDGAGCVARLGGDEFAVLLRQDADADRLHRLAARILAAMEASFTHEGQSITPKVSIGGACSEPGCDADALRQNADLALYHAKEAARGDYVAFSDSLGSAITRRIRLVQELDAGLNAEAVMAWYQPIIDLRTGAIKGGEALARLRQNGRVLTAGEFAPALDDRRNALRLTARMIDCVIADIAAWDRMGLRIPRMAINFGVHDFSCADLEQQIVTAFAKADMALDRLVIEVTESVFLTKGAYAVSHTVSRLRDRGALVALDDFGTGYASLAHLGTFPVDIIKMDKSFVARMADGGAGEIIAKALLELAQRLKIAVVAEGMETAAQLRHLRDLGCEYGQGYFFARPMPGDDMASFMKTYDTMQHRAV